MVTTEDPVRSSCTGVKEGKVLCTKDGSLFGFFVTQQLVYTKHLEQSGTNVHEAQVLSEGRAQMGDVKWYDMGG